MSQVVDVTARRVFTTILALWLSNAAWADEPPTVNPFAAQAASDLDAQPGCVELSDGKVYVGMTHLTRDARLKIYDDTLKRQREIPLGVVERIDCEVRREWMEKEWRFKELTADEKLVTGQEYPVREYVHAITLRDGRKIKGPLAALVYLRPEASASDRTSDKPRRFVLHKRDKGKPGTDLKSLVYVRSIRLGKKAMEDGRRKALKTTTDSRVKGH